MTYYNTLLPACISIHMAIVVNLLYLIDLSVMNISRMMFLKMFIPYPTSQKILMFLSQLILIEGLLTSFFERICISHCSSALVELNQLEFSVGFRCFFCNWKSRTAGESAWEFRCTVCLHCELVWQFPFNYATFPSQILLIFPLYSVIITGICLMPTVTWFLVVELNQQKKSHP